MEITLELSPNKWPPPETLAALFDANLDAMLALPLVTMFGGVRRELPPSLIIIKQSVLREALCLSTRH